MPQKFISGSMPDTVKVMRLSISYLFKMLGDKVIYNNESATRIAAPVYFLRLRFLMECSCPRIAQAGIS